MIKVLLTILLGTMLSGVWFGIRIIFELLAEVTKIKGLSRFSTVLAAIVPTIVIVKYSNLNLWNADSALDLESWGTVLVTVLITALIVSNNKVDRLPQGKKLLEYAVDGVMMEIPQRMMMQSFLCLVLEWWEIDRGFSVMLTAIVWCISICIQCVITKTKFEKSVAVELMSSFVFSVGVGTVLLKTEFIVFTMVAHFMERIISTELRRRKCVREVN